jgi:hypothetical protein
MENIESVLSTTTVDFPLPAPAVDWEAKYNESIAQHRLTNESYSTHIKNSNASMEIISNMFFDEAEKREWCAEAYDFVESINDALPSGFSIPLRLQEFTVMVTVTGEVSENHEVSVKARNQEEADTEVSDNPDDHFDPDDVLRSMNLRWATIENIEVTVD